MCLPAAVPQSIQVEASIVSCCHSCQGSTVVTLALQVRKVVLDTFLLSSVVGYSMVVATAYTIFWVMLTLLANLPHSPKDFIRSSFGRAAIATVSTTGHNRLGSHPITSKSALWRYEGMFREAFFDYA